MSSICSRLPCVRNYSPAQSPVDQPDSCKETIQVNKTTTGCINLENIKKACIFSLKTLTVVGLACGGLYALRPTKNPQPQPDPMAPCLSSHDVDIVVEKLAQSCQNICKQAFGEHCVESQFTFVSNLHCKMVVDIGGAQQFINLMKSGENVFVEGMNSSEKSFVGSYQAAQSGMTNEFKNIFADTRSYHQIHDYLNRKDFSNPTCQEVYNPTFKRESALDAHELPKYCLDHLKGLCIPLTTTISDKIDSNDQQPVSQPSAQAEIPVYEAGNTPQAEEPISTPSEIPVYEAGNVPQAEEPISTPSEIPVFEAWNTPQAEEQIPTPSEEPVYEAESKPNQDQENPLFGPKTRAENNAQFFEEMRQERRQEGEFSAR